jgi:recombination associated protein RdgC
MWFKQVQVFKVTSSIPKEDFLEAQLEKLEFEACKEHTPMTAGWVAPIDEEDNYLVHAYKNYFLFCLQIEEKVLPTYVIQQELKARLKEIEAVEQREVSSKEKYALKGEIYATLLPKAFSRLSKVYAYFDTTNKRLILNTTNAKKTEIFTSMLQKTLDNIAFTTLPLKNLHTIMTNWLQKDNCPKPFYIEDACVLKEPTMASKIIRFNGQDLFAESIQLFLADGYKVDQIVITWHDRATFVLKENFTMGTIKYADTVIAEIKECQAETKQEELEANFIIMTGVIEHLISDLLKICEKRNNE